MSQRLKTFIKEILAADQGCDDDVRDTLMTLNFALIGRHEDFFRRFKAPKDVERALDGMTVKRPTEYTGDFCRLETVVHFDDNGAIITDALLDAIKDELDVMFSGLEDAETLKRIVRPLVPIHRRGFSMVGGDPVMLIGTFFSYKQKKIDYWGDDSDSRMTIS